MLLLGAWQELCLHVLIFDKVEIFGLWIQQMERTVIKLPAWFGSASHIDSAAPFNCFVTSWNFMRGKG